ncbi:MAG: alpha/beta hydrolase [Gemmatimonadaceae bacterium]
MKKGLSVLILLYAAGCAAQSGGSADASLPPAPTAIVEEDATLATPTGNIAGTVELPAARFPVPAVLIIAGSGPTDRNGNSPVFPGPNNSLKMLADSLAARGIASLRYDKRGIAGSRAAGTAEADLRFEHYISDAVAWVSHLRADRRYSTVTVAGHSEGSLIGMVAAREADADGYVSIAGVGRRAPAILQEQLSAQLPPAMLAQTEAIMAQIARGESPDSVPPMLNALFRPSVQPYLTSWFAYDPAAEIGKLAIPVLIIQGTTDIQVKVDEANRLSAANPRAKLAVIEGMNHVLKSASGLIGQQLPSYSDPNLPLLPAFVEEVATFVKSLPAR